MPFQAADITKVSQPENDAIGPLSHTAEVTWDDLRAHFNRMGIGTSASAPPTLRWHLAALSLGAMIPLALLFRPPMLIAVAVLGVIAIFVVFLLATPISRRQSQGPWIRLTRIPELSGLVGSFSFSLDPSGVTTIGATTSRRISWADVSEIEQMDGLLRIETVTGDAVFIPERSFASAAAQAAFTQAALGLWAAGRDGEPRSTDNPARGDWITVDLTENELAAASRALVRRRLVPELTGDTVWRVVLGTFVAWIFWPWTNGPVNLVLGPAFVILAASPLLSKALLRPWQADRAARSRYRRRRGGGYDWRSRIEIDEIGITEWNRGSVDSTRWTGIVRLDIGDDRALIHTGSAMLIIPRTAFPSAAAYRDFVSRAHEYRQRAA